MGMITETRMWQEVKATNKLLETLIEEQKIANRLIDDLIQVMQGQPRKWYPAEQR